MATVAAGQAIADARGATAGGGMVAAPVGVVVASAKAMAMGAEGNSSRSHAMRASDPEAVEAVAEGRMAVLEGKGTARAWVEEAADTAEPPAMLQEAAEGAERGAAAAADWKVAAPNMLPMAQSTTPHRRRAMCHHPAA